MEATGQAVFVILVRDHEALFVRHRESSDNPTETYGLPGGKIEPGEDPRESAAREVFEETGLIVQSSSLVKYGTHSTDIETKRGMETWTVDLYLCRRFDGEIKQVEKAEEPSWLKIDDVLGGTYRMPKMSGEYISFIMSILRDQKKG